jgi:NAD(P)-dependent dehydrogenase (short-subunit alcohol dehydrogenase family)
MNIENKTVIVTGGASGLGAAVARRMHKMGANIIIADINHENGNKIYSELADRTTFINVDITDTTSVQKLVRRTMDTYKSIHIIVNCAGSAWVSKTIGKTGPHDLDEFKSIINLNLVGTFDTIRLSAFEMQKNKPNEDGERGVIVNTASIAAFDGQMGQVAYSASKAGVVGMTLVISRDLARFGIRCCTIAPGVIETTLSRLMPQKTREKLLEETPFPKRFGDPCEFASLVQQIVENPFLNGETIRLDGAIRMPSK